jgi:cyclase
MTRLLLSSLLAVVVAVTVVVQAGYAQQNPDTAEIHVLPVQGNIYMVVGAGGNITAQVGAQGVLLVDTQFAALSGKILAAISKLTARRLRYIINTSADTDHTDGNENLRNAGAMVFAGPGAGAINNAAEGAAVYAHINVLNRMSAPTGTRSPTPSSAWPTDTYAGDVKELYFNGESIQVLHQPAAHTDGDSLVYFRRSDVVSSGDIFVTTGFPVIDLARGGSLQGEIEALNRLLDIMIPEHEQEGGTMVIPGHGRLCDEADVVEYRDMVVIIRDRIRAMIKKGMTLDQVTAARPTRDYDRLYSATQGSWTPSRFVEAAYKSLSPKP